MLPDLKRLSKIYIFRLLTHPQPPEGGSRHIKQSSLQGVGGGAEAVFKKFRQPLKDTSFKA